MLRKRRVSQHVPQMSRSLLPPHISRGRRQKSDYDGGLAGGSPTMVADKRHDQNPEGGKIVTHVPLI
jgi:hypothetical protein